MFKNHFNLQDSLKNYLDMFFIKNFEHRWILAITTAEFVAGYHGGKHGRIWWFPMVGNHILDLRGFSKMFLCSLASPDIDKVKWRTGK